MKIVKLKYLIAVCMTMVMFTSCNENSFLEEKPMDFYSPDNSMETVTNFQTATNYLYDKIRKNQWSINSDAQWALFYGTDFASTALDPGENWTKLNDYKNTMTSTYYVVKTIWDAYYNIIFNANVIINRASLSESLSDSDKSQFKAEALFFRAYSYTLLNDLYGGVPLVLNEIEKPRRDYVRASRTEVYQQIRKDLEEAISVLPNIDEVNDGKVSKQVAQHLLAQTCNSLGDYTAAIAAATAVIDYPATALMTQRFGTYANELGDVYSDLFREGNYNRSSGNTESLWVLQYDYQASGSDYSWDPTRFMVPFYQNLKVTAKNDQGEDVTTTAFLGVTDLKCGRGIGWLRPTPYFFNELWASDFDNDIRNSQYNILRDVKIDNPASPAFGKWLVKDGYLNPVDTLRYWYPILRKTAPTKFPEDLYMKDANGNSLVTAFGEHLLLNQASKSYKDAYVYRLAETYLLRAEAYIEAGNKAKAAEDINIIRARANAKPVSASQVDIDYLLDERMRELYGEEMRMPLLCRLSKQYERTKKYNPFSGCSIESYHNLWPIPYSEIERNVDAEITQNPSY